MESLGAFPEGEWESISRMFFTDQEADFTVQYLFPNDHNEGFNFGTSSGFWSSNEANANMAEINESLLYSSDNLNSNFFHFSQESSASSPSSSVFLPTLSQETYYLSDPNHIPVTNNNTPDSEAIEFCMLDEKNIGSAISVFPDDALMREVVCLTEEMELDGGHSEAVIVPGKESQLKRKSEMPELQARVGDKTTAMIQENLKKRSRVSRDVQRINKNVQSKKSKVTANGNDEEETNAGQNGQTSSCYSSEDDSNASQELNGGGATSDSKVSAALNLNGKTRANRGSATDPQSLYARKRRERINERLKVLQNIVPNGTKVDISTMLEEAVQYVKFLQLQIKLLSSDDLWMYSPIAYNGMDIGLLQALSPTL